MQRKAIIIGGIAAAVAVLTVGIVAGTSKSSTAVAAAPAPAPVTVTAPPKTVRVPGPMTTVTMAPPTPTVKAAAEYQVTYRVISAEGSSIDMYYDSGVYAVDDPEHGMKSEDSVTEAVAERTVTMHSGDWPYLGASVGFREPGKIESCQILVNGVVADEQKVDDNKGTQLSCSDADKLL